MVHKAAEHADEYLQLSVGRLMYNSDSLDKHKLLLCHLAAHPLYFFSSGASLAASF